MPFSDPDPETDPDPELDPGTGGAGDTDTEVFVVLVVLCGVEGAWWLFEGGRTKGAELILTALPQLRIIL